MRESEPTQLASVVSSISANANVPERADSESYVFFRLHYVMLTKGLHRMVTLLPPFKQVDEHRA